MSAGSFPKQRSEESRRLRKLSIINYVLTRNPAIAMLTRFQVGGGNRKLAAEIDGRLNNSVREGQLCFGMDNIYFLLFQVIHDRSTSKFTWLTV